MAGVSTQFKKGSTPWNKGLKLGSNPAHSLRLKGRALSEEHKQNISKGMLGKECAEDKKLKISLANKGKKRTVEEREKMSISHKGIPLSKEHRERISVANVGRKGTSLIGESHPRWITDRTLLVKNEKKHLDGRYREWMKAVKNRDGWKCRIADHNCNGRLEAHHILRWSKHPELRYEVNNGISLCAFHHPRKINDEERLIPTFTELVLTVN
jgi:hypothetical protein